LGFQLLDVGDDLPDTRVVELERLGDVVEDAKVVHDQTMSA